MQYPLKNDNLIRALLREPVDHTPVWLMRQAGRYLPEYRAVREKAGDFVALCKTPEFACEVTLQPLKRFPLDAAILFSDILTIPDAMGLGLYFVESEGPCFAQSVRSESDVQKLSIPDPNLELSYVMQTISLVQEALNGQVPLIGFAGSPWTLACYMVEGRSNPMFTQIKRMLYQTPAVLHSLLDKLAQAVINYLKAQIAAGVDAIMLFDTWGGNLAASHYQAFSLFYMKKILDNLPRVYAGRRIPTIVFTKGAGVWLENIAAIGCDAVGLDWTIDIAEAKARVGHRVALQGNLDPSALYASPGELFKEVKQVMDRYGQGPGHVFNLGHGIAPDVDPHHVAVLVEAVHELSLKTKGS